MILSAGATVRHGCVLGSPGGAGCLGQQQLLIIILAIPPTRSRVVRVLCRRTKNNPVLIGEPGVGKTAIVEGLAQRIVKGDVPATLAVSHRKG